MIGFVKGKNLTTEEITQYRTARFNHILEDEKMIRKAQELIDKVAKKFGVNAEDVRNKKALRQLFLFEKKIRMLHKNYIVHGKNGYKLTVLQLYITWVQIKTAKTQKHLYCLVFTKALEQSGAYFL